jgi:hypothetical protein
VYWPLKIFWCITKCIGSLEIALKVPWIVYKPFELTKMTFVYNGKLESEITFCMRSYNQKFVNFFRFFFIEKLRVSEDMSQKRNILEVIFRTGFFSSNCTNYTFISSPTINFKTTKKDANFSCVGGLKATFTHTEDFCTHLSSNNR